MPPVSLDDRRAHVSLVRDMIVYRIIARIGVALAWLWALLALILFPAWPLWARCAGMIVWLVGSAFVWWEVSRRKLWIVCGVLIVWLLWAFNTPSNDRAWMPDQERLATATTSGDLVTIHNVRHAIYRTTDDYDVRWTERRYDLTTIRTVDFVVEPFSSWRGLAHTLLAFGFADGEHVAISIEIRKERGESFSPVPGLFRHYELACVIGDERDLIALRANIRHDPVRVYPTKATPAQARALFESMLARANALATHPEFYHTLTNTCATNMLRHVNELRDNRVWFDWRILFPGYADELAWDIGLIDFTGTFEEARERFLINKRSALFPHIDGPTWSRQIRAGVPQPVATP